MGEELVCPKCRDRLRIRKESYFCPNCNISYPIIDNIPCFVNKDIRKEGFNAKTFKFLFEMEKKHFWHIGRKEIIYQILKRNYIKDNIKTLKMLELGCGSGSVLKYLKESGVNIEGGDISIEGLKFCKERVNVPLYQIDALNTPFPDESYSVIGLFDLIEHVEKDQDLLNEVFRICKKNGVVIITVPANKYLWSYFDIASGHKRRYTKNELIPKLERAGFKIERVSFYMFFLLPILWVFRKLSIFRNYSQNQDAITSLEVKTVPVINSIFLAFLRLEKKLIANFNLPYGVSLICLARKK